MGTEDERLTERIHIRVERRRWQMFQAFCAAQGVTISAALRQAMADLYDRYEREHGND